MSRREFLQWQQYYQQHPFDDHHRYHRPVALLSRQLSGLSIADALAFTENRVAVDAEVDVADDLAFQSVLALFGPLAQEAKET